MKKSLCILTSILLFSNFNSFISAQTQGTFTFSFTPTSHQGYQGTRNALAVWIETSTGTFVKTKLRYAGAGGGTSDHLPTWAVQSGGPASNCMSSLCNKTDATTGATLATFTAKTITWDGKDVLGTINGSLVPDGNYRVAIQETWNHGSTGTALRYFNFTKGPNQDVQSPAGDGNFTNIQLNWTPFAAGVSIVEENPEIIIHPNPTNGIFYVNFKKASEISVINALGEIIYNEKVNNETEGTKCIDLTKFNNGTYFIEIYNGNVHSSHEIILKK